MRAGLLIFVSLVGAGCAHRPITPVLPWEFEARLTYGEIRVLPVVEDVDLPGVNLDSYLGAGLPWYREPVRRTRTDQLSEVPSAVALAFPGAVNGALASSWTGEFRVGHYPIGGRERLLSALHGKADIEQTLGSLAQSVGGDASLFVWVTALDGSPLTAEGFPGELIVTDSGPVIVDLADEPYRVQARVGMALVAADGDVVIRYTDEFESVLSAGNGAHGVGREIAEALAYEVTKVWPCDPRLAIDDTRVHR